MGRCKVKPYEVNKRRDAEWQKWQMSSHSCWEYIVIPASSKTRMRYFCGARHTQGSCLLFCPSQCCWSWLSFGCLHSSSVPTQSGSSQQPSFLHTFQLKSLEVAGQQECHPDPCKANQIHFSGLPGSWMTSQVASIRTSPLSLRNREDLDCGKGRRGHVPFPFPNPEEALLLSYLGFLGHIPFFISSN